MSNLQGLFQADLRGAEDLLSECSSYWKSGALSQTATAAKGVEPDSNYDFLSFLGIAQRQQIDFLPITWQPALESVGEGRTAEIREALIDLQIRYAFKRIKRSQQDESRIFRELISEISVLGHESIRNHPNIMRLEGICWDIPAGDEKVWPVLVFVKTNCGDLQKFADSEAGKTMCLGDRLKLCMDIGTAVKDLHSCHVIHGDIGPRNVLIFKKDSSNYVAKVSDFGYSTLVAGDSLIYMPRTKPWNAPEWHRRAFQMSDAIKMDVYSFGMLCLWLLFKDSEGYPCQSDIDELKSNDTLFAVAQQLVLTTPGLSHKQQSNLTSFFNLTIVYDPNRRSKDFKQLLGLLDQDGYTFFPIVESTETQKLLSQTSFEIIPSIYQMYLSDRRVRSHIAECLETRVFDSPSNRHSEVHSRKATFQLAFCHELGFGVEKDSKKSRALLGQIKMQYEELDHQISLVKCQSFDPIFQNSGFRTLREKGLMHEIDFDRHYGEHEQLDRIEQEYRREIIDVESVLGHMHPIVSILKSRLVRILNAHGLWKKSEELCSQIMETSVEIFGREHPNTLMSMEGLASIFWNQGRRADAEKLEVEIMEMSSEVLGPEHPDTLTRMANLASTYRHGERWKDAEELLIQVCRKREEILGLDSPATLTSIASLAWVYRDQGRWEEAEKLEIQVMETRTKVLGAEYPDTLASKTNLASTYMNQGRWKEAEGLFTQVMEKNLKILGTEHPDTLSSMSHLASAFSNQGQWEEAEKLEIRVMDMSLRILGMEHPDTLANMNNLALTYRNQGRWEDAEKLISQVIETRKRVHEMEHAQILACEAILASILWHQGRWKEAEQLEIQITEARKRILGTEHPDTLASMANLASVYRDQGQWQKAEELFTQVLEKNLRVSGTEHPTTLANMANLAGTFLQQGRLEKAEELYLQVLEIYKRTQGTEHSDTVTTTANLALTYRYQRRLKEAEELEVQILDMSLRALGPEHPDTLVSMANLAMTFSDQKRWNDAQKLGTQVMKIALRVLGAEHPDTLSSMHNLASIFSGQEQWEEAEKLYAQVIETRKRTLGTEHPETLRSVVNLAEILKAQGRHDEVIGLVTGLENF